MAEPSPSYPSKGNDAWRPPSYKRVVKACGSCRQSKIRCNGEFPCSRCRKHGRECIYLEKRPDPHDERFEKLEVEVQNLRDQVNLLCSGGQSEGAGMKHGVQPPITSPLTAPSLHGSNVATSPSVASRLGKRKRTQLELRNDRPVDFVSKGLITIDQAGSFFDTFFSGCDRYVPVFDPSYDTFTSIRARSSFLLDAICSVGCSIEGDLNSQLPHMLNFELKKVLNLIVLSREPQTVETLQALLVIACWSPERSLILSFATRLALDLRLYSAFEELTASLLDAGQGDVGSKLTLLRQSRVWFGLLVLENILHVDAGKLPTFSSKGGVRRCRVILRQLGSTALDLRLLSQVELNYLRAKIHDNLESSGKSDEDILPEIQDARIDVDLWFNDWSGYIENSATSGQETPSLLANLTVQRHWADAMALFRAVKCLGTENIDAMTPVARRLLALAKASLQAHLRTILLEPSHYLVNLRYAMDFVWAKTAFSFLLLLKLTRLLPDSEEGNYRLLQDGNRLLQHLSQAASSAGNSTSKLYLQVLSMSIEKYGRALRENQQGSAASGAAFSWETNSANTELQSFIPPQFVFEWDFPGLTLFSSPMAWQEFFDDYRLGYNLSAEDGPFE